MGKIKYDNKQVLFYDDINDFPAIGESGVVYVKLKAVAYDPTRMIDKTYRWSGVDYYVTSDNIYLNEDVYKMYIGNTLVNKIKVGSEALWDKVLDLKNIVFSRQIASPAGDNFYYGSAPFFNPSGTKAYFGRTRLKQYSLSTPFDLTTASLDYTGALDFGRSPTFRPDGLKLYCCISGNDSIATASLVTAYSLNAGYTMDYTHFTQASGYRAMSFGNNGYKLYLLDINNNSRIYQYTLSTAYNIDTATYDGVYADLNSFNAGSYGVLDFVISTDGKRLYFVMEDFTIYQVDLVSPWVISNYSYNNLHIYSWEGYSTNGVEFSCDFNVNKLFVYMSDGTLKEYNFQE